MRWVVKSSCLLIVMSGTLWGQDHRVDPVPPTVPVRQQKIIDGNVVQAVFTEDNDGKSGGKEEEKKTQEKRDQVAEQIRLAERKVQQENTSPDAKEIPKTAVNSDEEIRLRLLKQVDVILAQLAQQATSFDDTEKELVERTQELQNVKNGQLGLDPPFSFLLLDQLRDELAALQSKVSSSQLNQTLTNEDIVQAKLLLEQKEQAFRKAKENKEVVVQAGVEDNSRYALEIRLAKETLGYRKKRLEILKTREKVNITQVEIVKTKIEAIREGAKFSEEDLKNKQAEISKREEDLRRKLRQIEWSMEVSDGQWLSDRKLLSSEVKPTQVEAEQIDLRRLERQILQTEASSINFRLELLNQSRQAWDYRYQFANELSTSQQNIEFEKTTVKNLEQRDRDLSNRMLLLEELRKTIATLDAKIAAIPDDEAGRELRKISEQQKIAIRTRMSSYDEDVASIQANRRNMEKLLADLRGDANRFSFTQLMEKAWYYTKNVWNTELTSVDERPITIGKVIIALIIFVGGFWIARIFSKRLRGFLTGRLRIDESAAAAFQSLAFYGLVMMFILGALNFVSIPLTVFTFLGGALAIGVGFGSQNILSNFISGLILLAERPVKVGDLIQMDEFYGNIENIGARSTIVRTGTNLRLIVPNSKFLENNVINLTHGNNELIRANIAVGVAYGSPTRSVTKLLKQAADDHGLVMKTPEPFVLFREFGDNSLNFELHFWINVRRPLDRLKMESDVRYRIDTLFHESGIVISFPQRDIHIDTTSPIDIRLLNGGNSAALKQSDAA